MATTRDGVNDWAFLRHGRESPRVTLRPHGTFQGGYYLDTLINGATGCPHRSTILTITIGFDGLSLLRGSEARADDLEMRIGGEHVAGGAAPRGRDRRRICPLGAPSIIAAPPAWRRERHAESQKRISGGVGGQFRRSAIWIALVALGGPASPTPGSTIPPSARSAGARSGAGGALGAGQPDVIHSHDHADSRRPSARSPRWDWTAAVVGTREELGEEVARRRLGQRVGPRGGGRR